MQPLRLKKNTRFLITLAGVFAIGVATGLLLSSLILSVFVAIGGIAVIALLRDVFKDILASGKKPFIDYHEVIVENRSLGQHGGDYKSTIYFLIIANKTKNTIAESCKASLESSDIPISRFYAIWQISNAEGISIGQDERLKLFTRSDFKSSTETKNQIAFHTRVGNPEYSLDDDLLKAKIKISIQCANGDFPSDPYVKTIKEIMNSVKNP